MCQQQAILDRNQVYPFELKANDQTNLNFVFTYYPNSPLMCQHFSGHKVWSGHEQWGTHKAAYSSVGFSHIGLVLAELYGVQAYHLLWNRLLKPIGFSGISFYRPSSHPGIKWSTEGGLKMTPRDFARFAYFLLNDGRWGKQQILPEDWLQQFITTPYYMNLRSNSDNFFGEQYPPNMYRIFGSGGNLAFIIPSHNMIVLRTGRVHNFFHKVLQRDFLRRAFHMIPGFSIGTHS